MFHAFEVESVEKYVHGLDDVYIGLVESKKKHPNADRLNITEVNVGRLGTYQIVCGAPNVEAGQKVAVVLPGAKLPGDFLIEAREIRGVKSSGMICSEAELGLGEGHAGILVLPANAPVGALFAKHFGIDDSILDIKILPDRAGDALSYHGVAREIAALDGYAPQFSDIEKKKLRIPSYNRAPKVAIADKQGCSRYLGLYFENVKNEDSPLWLKIRLLLSGLRPKNAVVDITNYLMLLTGQPVHAFDADKLVKGITVRKAKKGEKLKILTGETIKLDTHDVVIADTQGPVALAGVMGGSRTAVTSKTKYVFLEIASFDALSVRKTRTRHRLFTDASYRYERGLDNNLPKEVAMEAVELFQDLTGAKLLGMRDEKIGTFTKTRHIKLGLERVSGILGSKIPLFEVVQYLALLGLKVKTLSDRKTLDVTIPTRRKDLVDEWNLIEEVARMRGYDKVLAEAPKLPLTLSETTNFYQFEDQIKDFWAARGGTEVLTYSFLSPREGQVLGANYKMYSLTNALNPEESILRPSLLPGLIKALFNNVRTQSSLRFFEVGNIFWKGKSAPTEQTTLAWVHTAPSTDGSASFLTAKSELESFFAVFGVPERRYEIVKSPIFETGLAAAVFIGKHKVAEVGVISRNFSELYSKHSVAIMGAEIFLEPLQQLLAEQEFVFQPISRFPVATRDISLAVSKNVTAEKIERIFKKHGAPLLRSFSLFDVFEKNESKRFGYHLTFGLQDRTITSAEVEEAFQKIVEGAEADLGASL